MCRLLIGAAEFRNPPPARRRLRDSDPVWAIVLAGGEEIATGACCGIHSGDDIGRFRDGAILVTEMTDPDWVPIMKRAAGIITDHGGTTSHAAIVSRELGVPTIVGVDEVQQILSKALSGGA